MIRDREVAEGNVVIFGPVDHLSWLQTQAPLTSLSTPTSQATTLVIGSCDGCGPCETKPQQFQSKQMWNWLPEMAHLKWTSYPQSGIGRWWKATDDKCGLLPILDLWQFGQHYQFRGNLSLQGHKDLSRVHPIKEVSWTAIFLLRYPDFHSMLLMDFISLIINHWLKMYFNGLLSKSFFPWVKMLMGGSVSDIKWNLPIVGKGRSLENFMGMGNVSGIWRSIWITPYLTLGESFKMWCIVANSFIMGTLAGTFIHMEYSYGSDQTI